MKKLFSKNLKRGISILSAAAIMAGGTAMFTGCDSSKIKLDPKNPTTVTIWHYYNSATMNAFEEAIKDFNNTKGKEEGIIVEGRGLGSIPELEAAVLSSSKGEVGALELPNAFASYADTAYAAEKQGILADLSDYLTKEEQAEYVDSYIEEGKIGLNGELRIFPIAKSTEIMMINETDWLTFAEENDVSYDDLKTIEGLTKTSKLYYEWTDNLTPDIENDGKAFYGRDSVANLFIAASKEFSTKIFEVENGEVTINVNDEVMRKIWDNYYTPFISGHFAAYGRYRSDDAKVGDLLAYVGSTSSAAYFPKEVTIDGEMRPIKAKALPAPHFEDGEHVMIQQGAGIVVTKSTKEKEYATTVFLKWFTQPEINIGFSATSGYTPVKKSAIDYDVLVNTLSEKGQNIDALTGEVISTTLNEIKTSEMYTNKAFNGGVEARQVLEQNLHNKAVSDRATVVSLINDGTSYDEAVNSFIGDSEFEKWLNSFKTELNNAVAPKPEG